MNTRKLKLRAEQLGIPWRTLYNRINVLGWSLEEALTTRRYKGQERRFSEEHKREVVRLYQEMLRDRQLASELVFGHPIATIRRWLKLY